MKRFAAIALAVCLCVGLAGCDGIDYLKAMDLYEEGQYAQALEIYRELGDYADSAAMTEICQNKVDYAKAEELYAAGDYRGALELYQAHERYEDSAAKSLRCRYEIGLGCIGSGEYEEAISWLEALGGYEDSAANAEKARWLWLYSHILENGPVKAELESSNTVLLLEANEDGTMTLSYSQEGYLLGMPYTNEMKLELVQGEKTATYTVTCVSTSTSEIREEAAGIVTLASFTVNSQMEMDSFQQIMTDPEGEQTISENRDEALMIDGLILAAQADITENLTAMLEQTGVDITVRNLGFWAFE